MTTGTVIGAPPGSASVTGAGVGRRWRRTLIVVLAVLWLTDAALQYQPYMFTTDFPTDVIAPTAAGNPHWVAGPVTWAGDLMLHHIVILNAVFASVQLLIALGLFVPRTVRLALAGSVVWAVAVWWLGTGLGGVLAGPVSPLAGFPGAVIVYALVAVLLWPRAARPLGGGGAVSLAAGSPLRRIGATVVWVALWAAFAFEVLRPALRADSALHDQVAGAAAGEPQWINDVDVWAAARLAGRSLTASVVLAGCFVLIALGMLVRATRRAAVVLAVIVALAIWVIAENFGTIATGKATDVNSGPPLVLLALCYWPLRSPPAVLDEDHDDRLPAGA